MRVNKARTSPVKGMPKSILKRPQNHDDPEVRGVRWDEDNIMVNDAQKDSTMKIDEPKTPFIHYNHETDEATTDGVQPFELEKAMAQISTTSRGSIISDERDDNEWSNDDDTKQQEQDEKHRIFTKARQAHYNMRNTLQEHQSSSESNK